MKPPVDIAVTEKEIKPNCAYEIVIKESNHSCTINYTVPKCVGRICDCDDFYKMKPRILKITAAENDNFIVDWDPGIASDNGVSSNIVKVLYF